MKQLLLVSVAVAALCGAASADSSHNWGIQGTSYPNTTGGTVYELDAPTDAALIGGASTVLTGAGPNGHDAYYRPGNAGSGDDSSQYMWDFTGVTLANNGTALAPGLYSMQVYVSNYNGLPHEDNAVVGNANGAWGYHAMSNFSSWNGVSQSTPGWTAPGDWGTGTGGKAWLSNTGYWNGSNWGDMSISVKWNAWGGYGGVAVSGVRFSTNGNFEPVASPEPASALLMLLALPLLRRKSR